MAKHMAKHKAKHLKSTTKTYFIHDNYARPFKVEIKGNIVNIFSKVNENDYQLLTSFTPQKIFIGKSPKNPMTLYSGGFGKKFDGNSILLHLDSDIYVYIGENIFSFHSLFPIKYYVSPVGNNDVPYPYAIDSNNNYYLLIEQVILSHLPKKYESTVYDYYYDASLITTDRSYIPPKKPFLKNFTNINKWFVGNEQYTLKYTPFPSIEYDRSVKPNLTMYITTKTNPNKKKLTKQQYTKLMIDFGNLLGFQRLKIIHTFHERRWGEVYMYKHT